MTRRIAGLDRHGQRSRRKRANRASALRTAMKTLWAPLRVRELVVGAVAFGLGVVGTVALSPILEVWLSPGVTTFTAMVDRDFDPNRPFEFIVQEADRRGNIYALADAADSDAERSAVLSYDFPSELIPIGRRFDQYLIKGFSTQPVIITSVTPVGLITEETASGAFIEIPSGSQGGTDILYLEVDLTSKVTTDGKGQELRSLPAPISIDENTRLLLDISTKNPPEGLTTWILEIGYLAPDDSRGTVYLDRFGILHETDDVSSDARFSITSRATTYQTVFAPGETTNQLEAKFDSPLLPD